MSGIQNVLWRHSIWKTMFLKCIYKQEKLPKLGFLRKKKKSIPQNTHGQNPDRLPPSKNKQVQVKNEAFASGLTSQNRNTRQQGAVVLTEKRSPAMLKEQAHVGLQPPAPMLFLKHTRHPPDLGPMLLLFLLECSFPVTTHSPLSLLPSQ